MSIGQAGGPAPDALEKFPPKARALINRMSESAGGLSAAQRGELSAMLGLNMSGLMIELLPVARSFARVPISGFRVGAVALASKSGDPEQAGLFMGANLEFKGLSLFMSVHAEQAAAANAWRQGHSHIHALAASEPPCGHCRQFLNEFNQDGKLRLIIPDKNKGGNLELPLSELLPHGFGPMNLGMAGLIHNEDPGGSALELMNGFDEDELTRAALAAANKSYAPYSGNQAGCAVLAASGAVYTGSYLENAAYNPSFSAMHDAILCLILSGGRAEGNLARVALVEKRTLISQELAARSLLTALQPGLELEYLKTK